MTPTDHEDLSGLQVHTPGGASAAPLSPVEAPQAGDAPATGGQRRRLAPVVVAATVGVAVAGAGGAAVGQALTPHATAGQQGGTATGHWDGTRHRGMDRPPQQDGAGVQQDGTQQDGTQQGTSSQGASPQDQQASGGTAQQGAAPQGMPQQDQQQQDQQGVMPGSGQAPAGSSHGS